MSQYGSWLDAVKFNGSPIFKDACAEVDVNCPEFTGSAALGSSFKLSAENVDTDVVRGTIRLEPPPTYAFRDVNEGVSPSTGAYENTEFHLYNATAFVVKDVALIERDPERGARYMQAETKSVMEGLIKGFGAQFYYGGTRLASEDRGFKGIQTYVEKWKDELTVSAGGAPAESGPTGLTSVYLVRFDETNGVSWLFGRGGAFSLSDPTRTTAADPRNPTKILPVVRQEISCYPGLAYYSKYAAARIANVQTASVGTPESISTSALTLAHLGVAIKKMRAKPSVILMNYSAGLLLAASIATATVDGTTVSLSGRLLDQYAGIPICYTDSLVDDEPRVG